MTSDEITQFLQECRPKVRIPNEKCERWNKTRLDRLSVWRSAFRNISHWDLDVRWGIEFKGGLTYEVWSFFLTVNGSRPSFTAQVALGKFYFNGVEVRFEDLLGTYYEIDLSTDEAARQTIDDSLVRSISLVSQYL